MTSYASRVITPLLFNRAVKKLIFAPAENPRWVEITGLVRQRDRLIAALLFNGILRRGSSQRLLLHFKIWVWRLYSLCGDQLKRAHVNLEHRLLSGVLQGPSGFSLILNSHVIACKGGPSGFSLMLLSHVIAC
jgi:hypothetical protein